MSIIRKGGYSGKICDKCREWKILVEFPIDKKSKVFKGMRLPTCNACIKFLQQKQR